jgi:hypothetical protein
MSNGLYICLFIHLSLHPFFISVHPSSIHPTIEDLFIPLLFYTSVCIFRSIGPSIHPTVHPPVFLCSRLSIRLLVHPIIEDAFISLWKSKQRKYLTLVLVLMKSMRVPPKAEVRRLRNCGYRHLNRPLQLPTNVKVR